MFTATQQLADHLMRDGVSLATLWKITRRDGEVFTLTDSDKDIDLVTAGITFGRPASSEVYKSALGYVRSAMKQSTNLETDVLEILGAINLDGFEAEDLNAGRFDHALVEIGLCNWNDLSQGIIYLRRSYFGEVVTQAENYVVSVKSLTEMLSRIIVDTYTPTCRVDLGSEECAIDIDSESTQDGYAIKQVGTVTALLNDPDERLAFEVNITTVPLAPTGYFNDGLLVWTGTPGPSANQNGGLSFEVANWTTTGNDNITLLFPTPRPIAVGDTFHVYIGCDKRPQTCKTRFGSSADGRGNIRNYRGYPHIKPGYIPAKNRLYGIAWRP